MKNLLTLSLIFLCNIGLAQPKIQQDTSWQIIGSNSHVLFNGIFSIAEIDNTNGKILKITTIITYELSVPFNEFNLDWILDGDEECLLYTSHGIWVGFLDQIYKPNYSK